MNNASQIFENMMNTKKNKIKARDTYTHQTLVAFTFQINPTSSS
jgi:hypothetical protein